MPSTLQWCRCSRFRGRNLAECVAVRRRFRAKVGVFWQSLASTDKLPHLEISRITVLNPGTVCPPTEAVGSRLLTILTSMAAIASVTEHASASHQQKVIQLIDTEVHPTDLRDPLMFFVKLIV